MNHAPERIGALQIVNLMLSIYVLIALTIQHIFKLSLPIIHILDFFDTGVCIFFLGDFLYRLHTAPNKLNFIKWGWIDLISSIPTISSLRWGRFVRIFLILRLLRASKSIKILVTFLFRNKAKGSLATAAIVSFFLVLFASISILTLEDSPSSNIRSASDAVWWSVSTMSMIGSGDKYPVTSIGKMLAVLLAVCGVGLFGTFTAYTTRFFLDTHIDKEYEELLTEMADIKSLLKELTKKGLHTHEPTRSL